MTDKVKFPKTLQEAIQYFTDEETCIEFVANFRWPDGKAECPNCGSKDTTYMAARRVYRCRGCQKQFSVKVGSIFEESPIPLNKWLAAMWMIAGAKNGISSCEIARAVGVTQKSAWFMMHRIRLALQQGTFDSDDKMSGTIEADETFIGGLSRNMHADRRARTITGTGGAGKTAVFGLLERSPEKGKSKVHVQVIPNRWKSTLQPIIKDRVEEGSNVYTDELLSYRSLPAENFFHAFVKHAEYYVDGIVHTNGVENFWTLLKRSIKGTYVSVEPFHLFRYLDEQAFRFNERGGDDAERFLLAMVGIVGRRITYKQLTGKESVCPPSVNGAASAEV